MSPGRITPSVGIVRTPEGRVERTSTIDDVTVKEGRTGTLVFVKVRHEVSGLNASKDAGPPRSPRSLPPEGARPPWGGPAAGGPAPESEPRADAGAPHATLDSGHDAFALPAPRPLLGREGDLSALEALLAEHRHVTVLGAGGIDDKVVTAQIKAVNPLCRSTTGMCSVKRLMKRAASAAVAMAWRGVRSGRGSLQAQ